MPRPRQLVINEKFFETVDTEEKAYTLGFLYADGYNCVKRGRIVLALKDEDKAILEAIRNAMGADHPIRVRTYARNDGYSTHTGGLKTSAYLEINSRKLSDDLVKLGCGAAKTDRIRFPRFLQQHLWRHFLRGFFDGDGCISQRKTGRHITYIATVISNPSFIQDLVEVLRERFQKPYFVSRFKTKTHTLMMAGNIKTLEFLTWLYADCTIRLERKWRLYRDLVERSERPKLSNRLEIAVMVEAPNECGTLLRFPSYMAAARWLKVSGGTVGKACQRVEGRVRGHLVRKAA